MVLSRVDSKSGLLEVWMKSTEFPALACIARRRGELVGVVHSYVPNMLCERGARREERVGGRIPDEVAHVDALLQHRRDARW